jgi:hypothetical protein
MEERLFALFQSFAIDNCAYAVMSNLGGMPGLCGPQSRAGGDG